MNGGRSSITGCETSLPAFPRDQTDESREIFKAVRFKQRKRICGIINAMESWWRKSSWRLIILVAFLCAVTVGAVLAAVGTAARGPDLMLAPTAPQPTSSTLTPVSGPGVFNATPVALPSDPDDTACDAVGDFISLADWSTNVTILRVEIRPAPGIEFEGISLLTVTRHSVPESAYARCVRALPAAPRSLPPGPVVTLSSINGATVPVPVPVPAQGGTFDLTVRTPENSSRSPLLYAWFLYFNFTGLEAGSQGSETFIMLAPPA
jgi:hypothetical protein